MSRKNRIFIILILLSITMLLSNLKEAYASKDWYLESIIMSIEVQSGNVEVEYTAKGPGVKCPLTSEDILNLEYKQSLVYFEVWYKQENSSLYIDIFLNATILPSFEDGRDIADFIRLNLEEAFNLLNHQYEASNEYYHVDNIEFFEFRYMYSQISPQSFVDLFFMYKPNEGFGKLISSTFFHLEDNNEKKISFGLYRSNYQEIEPIFYKRINAKIVFPKVFEMVIGEEYTVSLEDLLDISSIERSRYSQGSKAQIIINQNETYFLLMSPRYFPLIMEIDFYDGIEDNISYYSFSTEVTESIDDLAIHFELEETTISYNQLNINPGTIATATFCVSVILFGVVWFYIRRKKNS
jgi:hypothetical protein